MQQVTVGDFLLGRVLDGLGQPADGKGALHGAGAKQYPIFAAPPDALTRRRISEPVGLGIRAIDGLLTMGKGQRMGIFAGSGVGKSTVLGMIARNTTADVNVICLVGERGREVLEFIESDLGEEGLRRSVLVIATGDKPPLVRLKAPLVATAIAEYFRDQGRDVMLMMDSVTRLAMAQREVGLAVGEPPATRGYPPSVFALLPKILERSGTSDKGTITACTPSWWKATTRTSRSRTRSGASWTGTSGFRGTWRRGATTRPLKWAAACRASCPRSLRPASASFGPAPARDLGDLQRGRRPDQHRRLRRRQQPAH